MFRALLTLLPLTVLLPADLKVGRCEGHRQIREVREQAPLAKREVREFGEKDLVILPDLRVKGLPRLPVNLPGLPADVAWRDAPQFLGLFTPPRATEGLYRTSVSPLGLDEVLDTIRADSSLSATTGSFVPLSVAASEAFGQSGSYNRWKLALLYGARRTRVARGPRIDDGQVVEAWTLISPYPDPTLSRLEAGTLRIVLDVRTRG